MATNKSDTTPINSETGDQTSTKEISLEDLGCFQGGSAMDQLPILKGYKTKTGANARLQISLMNSFITQDEYNVLQSGVEDDPYWR